MNKILGYVIGFGLIAMLPLSLCSNKKAEEAQVNTNKAEAPKSEAKSQATPAAQALPSTQAVQPLPQTQPKLIVANPNLIVGNNPAAVSAPSTSMVTAQNPNSALIVAQPVNPAIVAQPQVQPTTLAPAPAQADVNHSSKHYEPIAQPEKQKKAIARKVVKSEKPKPESKPVESVKTEPPTKQVSEQEGVIAKTGEAVNKTKDTTVDLFNKFKESVKNGATTRTCSAAESAMHTNGC